MQICAVGPRLNANAGTKWSRTESHGLALLCTAPHSFARLRIDFRCLLADDCVLAELVSATPKRLTRLGLAGGPDRAPSKSSSQVLAFHSLCPVSFKDLNSFSCRDAHAVARVIARVTGSATYSSHGVTLSSLLACDGPSCPCQACGNFVSFSTAGHSPGAKNEDGGIEVPVDS